MIGTAIVILICVAIAVALIAAIIMVLGAAAASVATFIPALMWVTWRVWLKVIRAVAVFVGSFLLFVFIICLGFCVPQAFQEKHTLFPVTTYYTALI